MADKKHCGAQTRSGKPCKARPMPNGRCRQHGGMATGAPKGNQNARKHGLYSRIYPAERIEEARQMQGDVNTELAIARLQLYRLLEVQRDQGDNPELDELKDETIANDDPNHEDKVKKARAKDAYAADEYYDPKEDDLEIGDPPTILKQTKVYRKRDWSVEVNRLIMLVAKLELQAISQEAAKLELERIKAQAEKIKRSEGANENVEDMTDERIDAELAKLLTRRT